MDLLAILSIHVHRLVFPAGSGVIPPVDLDVMFHPRQGFPSPVRWAGIPITAAVLRLDFRGQDVERRVIKSKIVLDDECSRRGPTLRYLGRC
jgi:hypothetical protein